jgi:D-aminoacyl-tRNA deacylase
MVTLLLASSQDPASMNLYHAVLKNTNWNKGIEMAHGIVHEHNLGLAHLLLISDKHHIFADNIDLTHEMHNGVQVNEVLVLSKHVSKSQIPALTVHLIGLPGQEPSGEMGEFGGHKGQLVPPSPRFASLFRCLCQISEVMGIDSEFDITIETTHHGPFLSKPTAYLEIGSTEEQWVREDAANIWALTIIKCLGLNGKRPLGEWQGEGNVMLGLGGGHYAPRHKSIISKTDVWVGHILANYSLIFDDFIEGEEISGSWQDSIQKSLEATQISFPGGDIFAHLDRKSFKAWQRNGILSYLNEQNIPVYRAKEIISLHKHKSSNDSPSE